MAEVREGSHGAPGLHITEHLTKSAFGLKPAFIPRVLEFLFDPSFDRPEGDVAEEVDGLGPGKGSGAKGHRSQNRLKRRIALIDVSPGQC